MYAWIQGPINLANRDSKQKTALWRLDARVYRLGRVEGPASSKCFASSGRERRVRESVRPFSGKWLRWRAWGTQGPGWPNFYDEYRIRICIECGIGTKCPRDVKLEAADQIVSRVVGLSSVVLSQLATRPVGNQKKAYPQRLSLSSLQEPPSTPLA